MIVIMLPWWSFKCSFSRVIKTAWEAFIHRESFLNFCLLVAHLIVMSKSKSKSVLDIEYIFEKFPLPWNFLCRFVNFPIILVPVIISHLSEEVVVEVVLLLVGLRRQEVSVQLVGQVIALRIMRMVMMMTMRMMWMMMVAVLTSATSTWLSSWVMWKLVAGASVTATTWIGSSGMFIENALKIKMLRHKQCEHCYHELKMQWKSIEFCTFAADTWG